MSSKSDYDYKANTVWIASDVRRGGVKLDLRHPGSDLNHFIIAPVSGRREGEQGMRTSLEVFEV